MSDVVVRKELAAVAFVLDELRQVLNALGHTIGHG